MSFNCSSPQVSSARPAAGGLLTSLAPALTDWLVERTGFRHPGSGALNGDQAGAVSSTASRRRALVRGKTRGAGTRDADLGDRRTTSSNPEYQSGGAISSPCPLRNGEPCARRKRGRTAHRSSSLCQPVRLDPRFPHSPSTDRLEPIGWSQRGVPGQPEPGSLRCSRAKIRRGPRRRGAHGAGLRSARRRRRTLDWDDAQRRDADCPIGLASRRMIAARGAARIEDLVAESGFSASQFARRFEMRVGMGQNCLRE